MDESPFLSMSPNPSLMVMVCKDCAGGDGPKDMRCESIVKPIPQNDPKTKKLK